MMNINDEDVSLGLVLSSRNYRIQTRLNNSSGAGVNANSRLDMAFAASDPLSELVWSPHNGLSLKCANSSLADKKPLLLWNVGPSSKGLSPSQCIRSEGNPDDNAVDQGNLAISQTIIDVDDTFCHKATLFGPSGNSPVPESEAKCKMEDDAGTKDAIQEEENCMDAREDDLCRPQNVQVADVAESSIRNAGLSTLVTGMNDSKVDMAIDVADCAEPLAKKLSEALVCSPPDLPNQKETDDDVSSAVGEANENKTKIPCPISAPPLKKMEASAENDLCLLVAKGTCNLGEIEPQREKSSPVEKSLTNSGICLSQAKGKEKALSDGDICGRSSNDVDDSHESVESCNSAGLLSRGVKRQSYDQELIVGSKRMKQMQGSSDSTSIVRRDSSFMNWISNMVKGLSSPNKEDSSSLAFTLACTNDIYGKNNQENVMCNETHDPASRNTGFKSIFQSSYCRNTNMSDAGVENVDDSIEEPEAVAVADKASPENLSRSREGSEDNSCKQIVVSNKEVNPDVVGRLSKPWVFAAGSAAPHASETDLLGDKASDILVCNRAKDGAIPSDSSGKQMNRTAERTSVDITLAVSNGPGKINPLNSLWITRLSTRTRMLEKCDKVTQDADACSTDCPKGDHDSRENDVFPIDQKISEVKDVSPDCPVYASEKEIQMLTANGEASVGLKSPAKLSPILPPPKSRSSEAMASVFARRLDALRHIPSKTIDTPTCSATCFFCGSAHDLRECPQVTEAELEDLLAKSNLFERLAESPCLCIRCFELDHWAISCPLAPSTKHWRSEQNVSFFSRFTACRLQLRNGNEKRSSYHRGDEDHKLVAADRTAGCSKKLLSGSFPSNLTLDMNKCSNRRVSASNEIQRSTVSNFAKNVKDNQNYPPCKLFTAQNTVATSEIFHAVRNLRLSRANILRWMNSDVSLSHLNGFFLRLRLGKLEAELGGTGYYVACITGDASEHNSCQSKKSILVDVGGIRSSVGSQYVSNHDFSEDEIKAWWCRIVKSGCRIPSLDELNSKINDRKSLGF
ncbi:hypothetical protein Salat_0570400 [Sesamum alatum]|uniref:Plus3 domain-containing protein n=1 Tax=Sesamum alatum TaxID=300844 RepID=A0AAE1YQ26_9LAMI|nr:hypothetical protein Salat_0570400 [Sesamum alatum]